MDRASRMLLFVDVVNCGSYTKAAELRQITRSMVSKQIVRLEEELNARLFNRTTRSLSLTEIGDMVYRQALKLRDHMDDTDALVASYQDRVSGQLRISSASHFGPLHVQPVVNKFMKDYPEVRVELHLDNRFVNIVAEGYDLAIRITPLRDSNLIARKLSDNNVVIVASSEYIEQKGKPVSMTDLIQHNCVVYSAEGVIIDQWHYIENGQPKSVRVNPIYRTNDGNTLIDAIIQGVGIGLIPTFMIGSYFENKQLIPILTDIELTPYSPIYAMYHSREYLPPKIQLFLKYLTEYIGNPAFWDKWEKAD